MLDDPGGEHGFARVAQGEESRAPEIPIAEEVRHDGCRHRAHDDRPPRPRPERDQDTGGDPRGRPENGHALRLGQQSKAKPRRHEIDDADRGSERNRANPPLQVDAGEQLILSRSSESLAHPYSP
jgi:hypothetical protein